MFCSVAFRDDVSYCANITAQKTGRDKLNPGLTGMDLLNTFFDNSVFAQTMHALLAQRKEDSINKIYLFLCHHHLATLAEPVAAAAARPSLAKTERCNSRLTSLTPSDQLLNHTIP
jgi:hypothetical protein